MAIEDPNAAASSNEIVITMDTELSNLNFDSLTELVVKRIQDNMTEFVNSSKLIKSVDPVDLKNQTELALKDTDYQDLLDQAEKLKKQANDIRTGIYSDLEEDAKSGIDNDPDIVKRVDGLRDSIKSGIKYVDDINSAIKFELPAGFSKSSSSGSSNSTGVRRIRGFDFYTENGYKYENTGALAKSMAREIEEIQSLFFAAQGGDDSKKWSNEVSFTVPPNIVITARRSS